MDRIVGGDIYVEVASAMAWIPDELRRAAQEVAAGHSVRFAPRTILTWFGGQRRGRAYVWNIRQALEELRLRTEPDFEYAYIDGDIGLLPVEANVLEPPTAVTSPETPQFVNAAVEDPTYRIGKLPSANTPPTSVSPNATIAEAVTVMLLKDFSQLPVMQGDRSLKGAITWQSMGTVLALGRTCGTVQDCMEEAAVINSDTSLFAAIPRIVERGVRPGKRCPQPICRDCNYN